jgi:hypothetical protein
MTRKGFLGAILGLPCLGWVTKVDVRGEPTLKVIEPVTSGFIQEVTGTISNADSVAMTYTAGTASSEMWYLNGAVDVSRT